MKSAVLRFKVEATRPPTFTCAVGVNSTPLGLMMNTNPLAFRAPWITDTSAPSTRFKATACADGWMKLTVCPCPMEKPCQSVAILAVVWVMVMVVPWVSTLPDPAVICGPVGSSVAEATEQVKSAAEATRGVSLCIPHARSRL